MRSSKWFSRLFNEKNNELPFFLFLTFILGAITIYSVITSASLRQPLVLTGFIGLMLIHIFLYWSALAVVSNPRRTIAYITVQGLLTFVINLMGQNLMLIFGLYLALIGISAGLFKVKGGLIGVVAGLLALSFVNYGFMVAWTNLVWWGIAILPMTSFVLIYVMLYNRQGEARAQAQALAAELELANRQLADYAGRVEDLTIANERQRMARELHDTLSQGLAGLILKLEAADAHLVKGHTERTREIIQQTLLQARTTLADARRAIDDLRAAPPESSLAEDLREETARFSASTGVACDLLVDPDLNLFLALSETIRRILSEALSNTARHARATAITIRVGCAGSQVEVRYADNGIGFDPATVSHQPGHYGLLGMSERASLAGGSLEVLSQPGAGMTLSVSLPLALPETQAGSAQ